MDEFGDSKPEVYQQFMCYQEEVNKRFQELEGMLGLAAQQLEKLKMRRAKDKKIRLDKPLAETRKDTNKEADSEPLHHLKLSFPKFVEGSDASEWLQDCEQYFTMFRVGNDKKVAVAGLQLQGISRRWFQTLIVERPNMQWPEFCKLMVVRFGAWEQEMIYDSFKQLQQTTTVEIYYAQFERYKEQLRERMPKLTEVFFVECFVGGLQGSIRETLKLLSPSTVEQAYRQARYYVKSTGYDKERSQGSIPNGKIEEIWGDTQADSLEQELILAALQGNSTAFSKPLEFHGEVEGTPALFLIDGDSSLRLIQKNLCEVLELATTAEPVVTPFPPNGNRICSQGQSTIVTGQRTGVELSTMAPLVQCGTSESQNQPKPKLVDFREEEIGNYQESPKYDEITGEDIDDGHSKEIILTL